MRQSFPQLSCQRSQYSPRSDRFHISSPTEVIGGDITTDLSQFSRDRTLANAWFTRQQVELLIALVQPTVNLLKKPFSSREAFGQAIDVAGKINRSQTIECRGNHSFTRGSVSTLATRDEKWRRFHGCPRLPQCTRHPKTVSVPTSLGPPT